MDELDQSCADRLRNTPRKSAAKVIGEPDIHLHEQIDGTTAAQILMRQLRMLLEKPSVGGSVDRLRRIHEIEQELRELNERPG